MTESADVTLDDLNEEQLQVVEVIGLEAYKWYYVKKKDS